MKLVDFKLDMPDKYGDILGTAYILVNNPTQDDIRRLKYEVHFHNKDGFIISESSYEEDCFIAPGEEDSFVVWVRLDNGKRFAGTNLDEIRAVAKVEVYAREFINLGRIPVPEDDEGFVTLTKPVSLNTFQGNINIIAFRPKHDDGDNINLNIFCTINNTADNGIYYDASLMTRLHDEEETEIHQEVEFAYISKSSTTLLQPTFFNLKCRELQNSMLSFSITLYRCVEFLTAEGLSAPSKKIAIGSNSSDP
jgi:hypothetical protein